jgi:hypothetical protein
VQLVKLRGDAYGRIEQASADAKEDPNIDCQREAKGEADVQQRADVHVTVAANVVGDLRGRKGEEQEEEGADELAHASDEQMADSVGQPSEARQAALPDAVRVLGVSCLHAWQDH